MKGLLLIFAGFLPVFSFAQMDTFSYHLGMVLANSVKSQGLEVNSYADFAKGFEQFMNGNSSAEELQSAQITVQSQFERQARLAVDREKKAGQEFLAKNRTRPEVKETASGLQYEVLTPGAGAHPSASDKVTVHYTGKTLDGNVFDSSVERGQPATFGLNQVISGWTEGVQLMQPGAKYRFYIPSQLAYGDRGAGEDIPPGATLIFDVELISIN